MNARIEQVERVPGRTEAWLDLAIDDKQGSHLRITLLDAPKFIEAAEKTPVVLRAQFILVRNSDGKLIRWAHRMNYCTARLCEPG